MDVECPYCERFAELMDASELNGKSALVWACLPCRAWVGVHKNDRTNRPLGTLADAGTRHARIMAHDRFDAIWQSWLTEDEPKNKVRAKAYAWLAEKLGIPVKECHIAWFDEKMCVRVIEICSREVVHE